MDGEGKRGGRRKEEGNEEMRKDGGAGVSKAEGKEERRKAGVQTSREREEKDRDIDYQNQGRSIQIPEQSKGCDATLTNDCISANTMKKKMF